MKGKKMTKEIPTAQITDVLAYLFETAGDHFSRESGLRPELQHTARAGYDTALEHLAYALNLPAFIHQAVDESVPVYRRLRARFPDPARGTKTYQGIRDKDANMKIFVNGRKLEANLPEPANFQDGQKNLNWQNDGSGALQLAAAILVDFYNDPHRAARLAPDFSRKLASSFGSWDSWTLTGEEVERICAEMELSHSS
jgi:hypothetical protein